MTLFHTHRGEVFGSDGLRGDSRFSAARAAKNIGGVEDDAPRDRHGKLRRLRNELMPHRNAQARAEFDVTQFPQRPTVLDDKWDF